MKQLTLDRDKAVSCITGLAFFLIFGACWIFFEAGIYPDSASYMNMQEGREPAYPLLLAAFRGIWGEDAYLRGITLLQDVLAAFSCWWLTVTVRRQFCLNSFLTGCVAGCTLIPYLLTPLASSSGMILNHAILTEGITFPLYTCYTVCMIKGLLGKERKEVFYMAAVFFVFILSMTRNQMLVSFAVWFAAVCFDIVRSRRWRYAVGAVVVCVLFLGARSLSGRIYNEAVFSGFEGADTGSYNVLTTLLYLTDSEDAALLSDETQRQLFLKMQGQMEEGRMNRKYAPEGLLNRAYHYEEYYDVIGFQVQQPVLFDTVKESGVPEGQVLNVVMATASDMSTALMPAVFWDYVQNYMAAAASGLVRSVSASGTVLGVYSVFIYFLAGILVIYLYKNDRKNKAALLMLLALLMICANVFATALVIMCLSRYMIYNTPLFYIAGLMLVKEALRLRKKNDRKKEAQNICGA